MTDGIVKFKTDDRSTEGTDIFRFLIIFKTVTVSVSAFVPGIRKAAASNRIVTIPDIIGTRFLD